ncbi:PadR family transcriptional regulator [Faecalicatena orotica]|uniref:PadR family transcriptional regulator n=1 Tax=Faecalicatena orotica TaxID=1544 RepID=UPI003217442A
MGEEKDLMGNLVSELRRGTLILSVLSQLGEAKYGYALVQSLELKGVEIDPNTLYPLLRRLEKQGLLSSQWDVGEAKPRKYYRRTLLGDDIFRELKEQWERLSANMEQILREELI